MPNADDKYTLKMRFSFQKEGKESDGWVLENDYMGMDYGNLVATQAVVLKTLGEALVGMGVVQAEALGFNVVETLAALEAAGEQPQEDFRGKTR